MSKMRTLAPLLLAAFTMAMTSVLAYADAGSKHKFSSMDAVQMSAAQIIEDAGCTDAGDNHGDVVSCVANKWGDLEDKEAYNGFNKGQIMRIVAQSDLGKGNHGEYENTDENGDNSGTATSSVTSVSIASNPGSPQSVGTSVTFTASSQPNISTEYKWWVRVSNGSWQEMTSWGGNSFTWGTSTLQAGTYEINVWARAAGSTGSYQAYSTIFYTLGTTTSSVNSVSVSANPESPENVGTSVTFTASPTPNISAEYRYYVRAQGTSSWDMLRDWGGASFTWDTSSKTAGTYEINVWARAAGSTGSYQAYSTIPYTLGTTTGTVTSVSVSADPESPQDVGGSVTFTASSQPSDTSAEYKYYIRAEGAVSWDVLRDWGGSSFTWNTGSTPAGDYEINVWARAAGSTGSYQAYSTIPYTLGTTNSLAPISTATPTVTPEPTATPTPRHGNGNGNGNGQGNKNK